MIYTNTDTISSPVQTDVAGGTTGTLQRPCQVPIRMLRLSQVIDMTGLGKTKIYELQAQGQFPMRVKITVNRVGWVEEQVQEWLARRVELSNPPPPRQTSAR
jgi:predicted DNA-binding transcriptional regulator AlpA